jgi:hypothetical protein
VAFLVGSPRFLRDRVELRQVLGIGAERLVGVAPLPARAPFRELLLEPAAVEEDDLDQLRARAREVDGAAEARADGQRQEAAVIEVGVRDQDRIQGGGVEAQRHPVADHVVRAALEHPAVDQDAGALGGDEEARAGDGARATEEAQLHATGSSGWVRGSPAEPCARFAGV